MTEMTDLTPIVTAAITLIAAILSVFVIPLIRSKVSAEKLQELYTYVRIGVLAAEQLAKAGIINKDERKERVIEFLHKNGFLVNFDEIEEMIESIVLTLPPLIVDDKGNQDDDKEPPSDNVEK